MATKQVVTKVWIDEGCIVCDACETACPEVFDVTDDTCLIRPEALNVEFNKPRTADIIDAAEECPVDVIKFDTVEQEVSDDEAAPAPAPTAAQAEAASSAEDTATAPTPPADAPKDAKPAPAVAAKAPAAAKSPVAASVAGQPDPAIAALLRAAATRGGTAGILRRSESTPDTVESWRRKDPKELPPDARHAKVMEAAKKASGKPDPGRRAVVGGTAVTVGWVAFGVGGGVAIGPAFARFMMPNVLEEPDPRIRVGPIKTYLEMAPGQVNEDYKSQGIWMIRLQDRIAALNIICTHLGCIPNWLPNDRKFKCPCHGSGYRPDGINFEGPTPRPLERFRVVMDGSQVIVDKSKKYQYELGQWDQPGSYLEV